MRCIHIVASGIVQGVGFRYYTQIEAEKHQLKGSVTNLPDGNVEIYAVGEEASLLKFLEWCHNGPPSAQVDSLKYSYIESKKYVGFNIIR